MPKKLDDRAIRDIEASVVPKQFRGKYEWPIEVEVLGQRARLRVIRGRKRIHFDWYVPEQYREIIGKERFLQQVPKPSRPVAREEDPGHDPNRAIDWLRGWLRDQVLRAEDAKERGEVVRDRSVPNDVPLRVLLDRFRASGHFEAATEEQRKQWALWLDFFAAALPPEFRMHQVSPSVLRRLHARYQEEWTRTLPDGRQETAGGSAGHNTAAKVVRFFGTMCRWAVSEPAGSGRYLLDTDPCARIPRDALRRLEELDKERRLVEGASEDFANALVKELATTGGSGQALLIFGTEAALGRRPGEIRALSRHRVLTTEKEIAKGLRRQLCRRALPGGHIPENEISEAANAYAERGWAVHFSEGKQAVRRPESVQHDRVVPLGRHLTSVYRDYLKRYWGPLGLAAEAPLCPAWSDTSRPTNRHVAMKWFKRARKKVEEREGPVEVPEGGSHTLRHRFRAAHRKAEDKVVAFVGGWSIRQQSAMNKHYLPIGWREVVEFIDRVDETTAKCLDGLVPAVE